MSKGVKTKAINIEDFGSEKNKAIIIEDFDYAT